MTEEKPKKKRFRDRIFRDPYVEVEE